MNGGGYSFPELTTLAKLLYVISSLVRPVSGGWWFVTAYVLLVLCAPVINGFVSRLSRHGYSVFLFAAWAFLYSSNCVLGSAYFPLVRAFFFYVLGAFVRFHLRQVKRREAAVMALLCIGLWTGIAFCSMAETAYADLTAGMSVQDAVVNRLLAIANSCIVVPVCAFCLFQLFGSFSIGCVPRVNALASATFGVYLLHDSLFGRLYIWNHLLDVSGRQFPSRFFPLFAVIDILAVFLICASIDLCRQKLIAPRLEKVEDALVRFGRKLLFS